MLRTPDLRREITAAQAKTWIKDFTYDLRAKTFRLSALPEGSFTRAKQIAIQTTALIGTRTADLLHVAAALELGCHRLYSLDERQRKLSQAVKLKLNLLA